MQKGIKTGSEREVKPLEYTFTRLMNVMLAEQFIET
jgi:hypothetical protein